MKLAMKMPMARYKAGTGDRLWSRAGSWTMSGARAGTWAGLWSGTGSRVWAWARIWTRMGDRAWARPVRKNQ